MKTSGPRWSRVELATIVGMVIALILLLGATFNAFQNSARLQATVDSADIAAGNEGDIAPAAGHLAHALLRWAGGEQMLKIIDINRGVLIRQLETAAAGAPTPEVRQRYGELRDRAQRLDASIEDQMARSPDPEHGPANPARTRELAAQADGIVTDAQRNRQHSNQSVYAQAVESQRIDDRNRRLAMVAAVLAFALGVTTIALLRRRLRVDHERAMAELTREDQRRQAAVDLVNHQASILEQVAAGAPTGEVHAAIDALADSQAEHVASVPEVSDADHPLAASARLLDIVRSRDRILDVLAHQATHDSLTDLLNRAALVDVLQKALRDNRSGDSWVAFLFCDLDRFKFINDSYGHDAGDDLLRQVAVCLRQVVGVNGQVGRMGGDEFGVVLTGTHAGDRPRQVAHRMVGAVDRLYKVAGRWVDVDVSVGVAVAPDHTLPAEELLQRADIALYAAKNQGRSHVAEFDVGLAAEAEHRRGVEQALQQALATGGLDVHYQPVVPTLGGPPTDIEALVRWQRDGVL
ncbi:diguanylate cyclase domain-containing protein, partial [Mycolicibacterium bacteremicum]|uniref:diguanylate cyclase domain-containing protein n=1 Tax=Mycolicibacterium bacteremicum TaxID=564198 RepID=UPI0026EB8BD6